ncbi:unnamed protein product [Ambrosiozyma monospora]|uniref:Unnamed protein product n=1 Tax=Ambrosiozyma monospora TaxID=43982 RepID=A0ACB5TE01_AMBMO|nr:unnamed protein product [Ambrosiozyma monospora]
MSLLVQTLVKLRREGHRIVLVSSGATAVGLNIMGFEKKPKRLAVKQALAAVGQGKLISMWDGMFRLLNQKTAQVLLTRNDINDFAQFRNAENTLLELLDMDVIPIVNENDTISTQEFKFGDNDTLSAITAGMCNADFLFLLTDVDCLYTDNPRTNPDATPVFVVKHMDNLDVNTKSSGSAVGTGGMETKLIAADLATNAGVTTVICNSETPQNMLDIVRYSCVADAEVRASEGQIVAQSKEEFDQANVDELKNLQENDIPLHTRFLGQPKNTVKNKEFWLLHGLKPNGSIIIDLGCYQAITRKKRAGLLPVGVIGVEGNFRHLECVDIKLGYKDSKTGKWDQSKPTYHVGRGRCNYQASEIELIMGMQSDELDSVLQYCDTEYVVHRENLAFPLHPDQELTEHLAELEL